MVSVYVLGESELLQHVQKSYYWSKSNLNDFVDLKNAEDKHGKSFLINAIMVLI